MSFLINFLVVVIFTAKLKDVVANPSIDNFANSDLTSRISGGARARGGQFQFVAGIGSLDHNNKTTICGGALISINRVLTSVGCVEGKTSITVVLGATNLTKGAREIFLQKFDNTSVSIHPGYDRAWVQPNLAIIKLVGKNAELNGYVQLAKLPTDDTEDYGGKAGTVFGWGKFSEDDPHTHMDSLHYVANRIFKNAGCKKDHPFLSGMLDDTLMCHGGSQNKGVCRGDGGSPLVILNMNNLLVGVLSFGHKQHARGHPAVYTRVNKYLDWIHAEIANSH